MFVAFDVLALNGRDLRSAPLLDRKAILGRIVPAHGTVVLYADHVAQRRRSLFERVCAEDLEGIVAKWARGTYATAPPTS